MPDPTIQPATNEIEAVLKKHDLVGCVFVQSASHSQWLYHLTTSWCPITNEGDGRLRIRAKAEEVGKERRDELVRNAASVIIGFGESCRRGMEAFGTIAKMLSGSLGEITHTERYEDPEKS